MEYYLLSIEKLYLLNLDEINPLVSGSYSKTGKPSNQQPELLR
ncbi:MAG: hypothetical protein K0R78_3420 [Pelosinus sp.]|jgi:hypothetical protein|nr:hypothetical protein [Pelosinus sp.]